MADHPEVDVLNKQMDALRTEVQKRVETDYAIWKLTFGGLAAIVVLKSDIRLEDYLPLVPLLGIALLHVLVTEMFYIFRINCSLARCEYQINRLLNVDNFLSHEIDFWKSRRRWFRQWKWLLVVAGITAFVLQWVLMHTYMPDSKFCDERGLRWPLYAISLLLPVLVTINFARTWKLLSQGTPEEIPHGGNPLAATLKPEVSE